MSHQSLQHMIKNIGIQLSSKIYEIKNMRRIWDIQRMFVSYMICTRTSGKINLKHAEPIDQKDQQLAAK
jgi:hypothetical protein